MDYNIIISQSCSITKRTRKYMKEASSTNLARINSDDINNPKW